MVENIAFVTYTNNNYNFIWNMHLSQLEKHCPNIKSYVFGDVNNPGFDNHEFVKYDNSWPYWKQWVESLKSVKEDYIIYLQEDFILYNDVDIQSIQRYLNFLIESNYSFVRLIRSGAFHHIHIKDDMYLIDRGQYSFAMQPTIWDKKVFENLYSEVAEEKWFECPKYIDVMNQLNIDGVYVYNNENKRGTNHYDSKVFPYIATAIVKGILNFREYSNELTVLCKDYDLKYDFLTLKPIK